MLELKKKKQFNEIFDELGKSLDITETQFNTAVASYQAVGEQLSKNDGLLAIYKPEILPQGSFMLGTMVKPINEEDDLDIDLVCNLVGKNSKWTQKILKKNVGNQLKQNEIYNSKIRMKDGRRCWTLYYRDSSDDPNDKYHLDILPSIVDSNYRKMFTESLRTQESSKDSEKLAIRITDKERSDFPFETNHNYWLKSNPFGYAKWFFAQAQISTTKRVMLSEAIKPVPNYLENKLPLQRVVQILKRHRDIMFNGDEDKPISIIITTLASRAYNKEENIIDALANVINNMPQYIEEVYSEKDERIIKRISNPVNEEENFADKWVEHPQRQKYFYAWLDKVKVDLESILKRKGLHNIEESMSKSFGETAVKKTFFSYGNQSRSLRESGELKMESKTGILGSVGTQVKPHNFYGKEEE
jgi:hypothetical protein